jgi:hypothetical protein
VVSTALLVVSAAVSVASVAAVLVVSAAVLVVSAAVSVASVAALLVVPEVPLVVVPEVALVPSLAASVAVPVVVDSVLLGSGSWAAAGPQSAASRSSARRMLTESAARRPCDRARLLTSAML